MQLRTTLQNLLGFSFIAILTFAFLLSGINLDAHNITHLTVFAGTLLGFILLLLSGNSFRVPRHFIPVLIFTIILQIYIVFVDQKTEPFNYLLLFIEAMSLWFIVYNLDQKITKYLPLFFMVPAGLYSILYFLTYFYNLNLLKLASLFFLLNRELGHIQIGSLWAVVLAFTFGLGLNRKKNLYDLFILAFGIYFLIIANSRTAYLALITVFIYVFSKKIPKRILYAGVFVASLAFIYMSTGKSTLTSRPYFYQSIAGFFEHPMGIGMGNFGSISEKYILSGTSPNIVSQDTHNIILEAVSGVGIFSIILILWLFNVLKDIVKHGISSHLEWTCIFLTITVIYMFDITYIIYGTFWLWFVSLGMLQRDQ